MSAPSLTLKMPVGSQPQHPLFVFVPGMDGSGDLLFTQLPFLQAHFDIRCLAIAPNDLTPWAALVEQTIHLIQRVATDRPIYLCGESFGACLALQVAARAPDLIHRLILINPASAFHRSPWLRWIAAITPWTAASLYQASTLGLLPLLVSLDRISRTSQQALLFAMRRVSQGSAGWRLALLSHFRPEELPLHRITRPCLLVAGQADRLLPSVEEAQRLAARLPQAQVYVLPASGHACLLEEGVNLGEILAATGLLPRPPLAL